MYSLEEEFIALRGRRVALRRSIRCQKNAMMIGGDYISAREQLILTERLLRDTERRWSELHALTGRRPAGPPVKLALPRATVRYAQRRAPAGYLNRMIATR